MKKLIGTAALSLSACAAQQSGNDSLLLVDEGADCQRPEPVVRVLPEALQGDARAAYRLAVREDGTVASVGLLSDPNDPSEDEARRAALSQWRFSPAQCDGSPVPWEIVQYVNWNESDAPMAEPIHRVAPRYPGRSADMMLGGCAGAHFVVGKDGKPRQIDVEWAFPKGMGFEEATRKALSRWRWAPSSVELTLTQRLDYRMVDGKIPMVCW